MTIDGINPLNQLFASYETDSVIKQQHKKHTTIIADNNEILPGYGYAYPSMIPKKNYDTARQNLQGDYTSVQESLNMKLSDHGAIYGIDHTGSFEVPAGSTLSEISKMFADNTDGSITWHKIQNNIMEANPQIISPDKINAGDILTIPESVTSKLQYPYEPETQQESSFNNPTPNLDQKREQLIAGEDPEIASEHSYTGHTPYMNQKQEQLISENRPFIDT